jgi:Galactose oxidase, central domain
MLSFVGFVAISPSVSQSQNANLIPMVARGRLWHTATMGVDGTVLVTGGICDDYPAELYLPATHSFTPTASLWFEREYGHTATLLPNSRVLIAGGEHTEPCGARRGSPQTRYVEFAELYDFARQEFMLAGKLIVPRTTHTATLLDNGQVLLAGGYAADVLNSAELYNYATNAFTKTGMLVEERYLHTATLLANGKVLITGGIGKTGYLKTAELYDPTKGTFAATGSMQIVRALHTATLLPTGQVLIVGGHDDSNSTTEELYDPVSGTFMPTGSLNFNSYGHKATLLADGRVMISGGGPGGTGFMYTYVKIYYPSTGTFVPARTMQEPRAIHESVRLSDGRVLAIAGGTYFSRNGWSVSNSAEILTPLVVQHFPLIISGTLQQRMHSGVQSEAETICVFLPQRDSAAARANAFHGQ